MDNKENKSVFKNLLLVVILIISVCSFTLCIINKNSITNFNNVFIGESILIIFSLMYTFFLFTHRTKKNTIINIASIILIAYYLFNLNNRFTILNLNSKVRLPLFSDKNITDVIKWSEKNNIAIDQSYEYSDLIKENNVIAQDKKDYIDKLETLNISISDGPNPSKEIIIPDMSDWTLEKAVKYIKENYLSNIVVDFNESEKLENTVISQSKVGSVKRDDEILLTFSLGEKFEEKEIKLKDLTNMDKIDAIIYLKQNRINYELNDNFSKKIKKGKVIKQSIDPGTTIKSGDSIVITLSKGKEITVPNLTKMSIKEISSWAIKNKLRLEFDYKHDEKVKKNKVIEANYKYKDKIKEKETLKIVLSSGKLKMPKFKDLEDFYNWANKYNIKYSEEHEFSDDIKQGEVISYSYKSGETIKNNDTIIIKISDGKQIEMPNVVGLSKKEAETRLSKLKINYTLTYSNSTKSKNTVIAQSISAGSKTSQNITVNLTISNGEKESSPEHNNETISNNKKTTSYTTAKVAEVNNNKPNTTKPTNTSCQVTTTTKVYLYEELYDFSNPSGTCSKIKSTYPNVKFNCQYKSSTGITKGIVINSGAVDSKSFTNCDSVTLQISN